MDLVFVVLIFFEIGRMDVFLLSTMIGIGLIVVQKPQKPLQGLLLAPDKLFCDFSFLTR